MQGVLLFKKQPMLREMAQTLMRKNDEASLCLSAKRESGRSSVLIASHLLNTLFAPCIYEFQRVHTESSMFFTTAIPSLLCVLMRCSNRANNKREQMNEVYYY